MAFPSGWGRKQKITIQSSQVVGSGTHSDLPVLVTLDHLDSEIVDAGSNSALNGGGDIRFSSDSAGTTQLACEIVSFVTNASAGSRECEIWVKVPSVSTSTNTDFYIWYNKSGESQPAASATYGSESVWTGWMIRTHNMLTDSTGNNTITVSNAGTVTDSPFGKNAYLFDGSNDYLTCTVTGIDLEGDGTATAWVRDDGQGDDVPNAVYIDDGSYFFALFMETYEGDGCAGVMGGISGGGGIGAYDTHGVVNGSWGYIRAVHDDSAGQHYVRVNKVDETDDTYDSYSSSGGGANTMVFGARSNGNNHFDGAVCEFGLRDGLISTDLTDTENNMMNAPASFASAGTPEAGSGEASLSNLDASHNHSAGTLTLTGNFPIADFAIQHISDDIGNSGGTNTSFTAVAELDNAFELANNNRKTHAGSVSSTGNMEGDDMAGARVLTATGTLTYYRESGSIAEDMRFETSIVEYVGDPGGDNEFIVRGRFSTTLNGTTNSVTETLSGVVDADDCIPFITGIMNNATADDFDSSTAIAYLENATTLRVQKGSNGNNVTVYVTVVEFTGSNWTVLHGDSGAVSADTGSITLYDGSDGTGTATDVSNWAQAVIIGHHRGDTDASGTNDAIADNWPTFDPGSNNQTVDWTFDANHDSAGTNRHFVHVLDHADLSVTRYQDTSDTQGESTINITSAGLTSTDQAIIVGSSISSGTGAALGRGSRNYYFNSTTEAAHWAHRSGNTMAHEIQIVDISALTTTPGGDTELVIVGASHGHGADGPALAQVHTLVISETLHGHAADVFGIVEHIDLAITDSSHGHSTDACNPVENLHLTMNAGNHGHAADDIIIDQIHQVAIGHATHQHLADSFALSQIHVLGINAASHDHNGDSCDVGEFSSLEIVDADHTIITDVIDINQIHFLGPDSTSHTLENGNISFAVASDLIIQNSTHTQSVENLDLDAGTTMQVQSSVHALLDAGLSLGYNVQLSVEGSGHNHFADRILPAQNHVMVIEASDHALFSDTPLIQTIISSDDAIHNHSSDTADFMQIHILQELDDLIDHTAGEPYVRISPGVWGLVGETVSGWTNENIASTNWSEQAEASKSWDEHAQNSNSWSIQSENPNDWEEQ